MAPGKDEKMKWYADWIRWQMADLSVDIRMRTAPTVADLRGYDVVINATGARSYVPEVHGLKEKVVPFEEAIACPKITCEFHPNNASRTDRLERKPRKLEGSKVVVWGDHYAAVDTATYFASIGKEVTIVTDRKEFAADVEVIHMYVTWKRFRQTEAEALTSKPYKYPVTVIPGSMVDEIREKEIVVVDRDFHRTTVACDAIVTCWTRPSTELLGQLKAAGVRVVNVGDSVTPRNLHAAVREGAAAGLQLDGSMLVNSNDAFMTDLPLDVRGQLVRCTQGGIMASPLKVLVAGIGGMGASHALGYTTTPGFTVGGFVVAKNVDRAKKLAADLKLSIPIYTDYYKAMAEVKPDVVSINTLADTHAAVFHPRHAPGLPHLHGEADREDRRRG